MDGNSPAIAPGIHPGMSFAEYRRIDAVNWSSLKHMLDSPKHYAHRLRNPAPQTRAQFAGALFHAALLEPEKFDQQFRVFPGDMPRKPTDAQRNAKKPSPETVEQIAAFDKLMDDMKGATIVDPHDRARAWRMADAVRNCPAAAQYIEGAQTELTIVWNDPATGILCKGRIDALKRVDGFWHLADPKGTASVEARRFGAECNRMHYHCQVAHYAAGLAVLGHPIDCAHLIACEFGDVHDVGVFFVDGPEMEIAMETRAQLMDDLLNCRLSDKWPGRYETEQQLQLPAYVTGAIEVEDAD